MAVLLLIMIDPFAEFAGFFASLVLKPLPAAIGGEALLPMTHAPRLAQGKPCALLLSPHPDDECLTGGLLLRLKQEVGWQIVNVAITLGSLPERKAERWAELTHACAALGFDVMLPVAEGFSDVRPETREKKTAFWQNMVRRIAEIFSQYTPQAVFLPHARDLHPAHMGTHLLGMDALATMPPGFSCSLAQSEWWHPHESPNRLIGLGVQDVGLLLKALCCHAKEIARNPYHLRFPAYLIDNVRRGSERILGERAAGPVMDFGMLYRVDHWENGRLLPSPDKRVIAAGEAVFGLS